MGLQKEKGKPSQVSRKVIQGKGFDGNDHWAFLEEIEAPLWADLTIEAQSVDNDIDDAWFRVSHPIHQMSSQQLKKSFKNVGKYQDILLISRCYSPKIPESVSRSRGKHYESRKWLGNVNGSLTAKQHPVRKLMGGKSLDTVKKKATTWNSSTSTITESSSSRKPLHNSSVLQANAATETSLSSCVMSKYQNLRPNSSFRGPRKTCDVKRVTSQVGGKVSSVAHISGMRGSRTAKYSTREITRGGISQNYNSSAGKSSVGSSCSPGSIVQNVNTTKIQKNGMCKEKKKASGTVIRAHETRIKDVTQRVHHQNKAGDAKLVCQKSESKALGPAALRKPLSQLNKSRPQKTGVVTIQRNFSLLGIKRILQCPIYVK
ncbi:unnamed protein product [Musa acuminata subsp. malaccensis]|uniref:(wild Malaysian banana) hypothetical protein n=1 Tax=Musa acuminata subsp. malaccensis TaxID=214687 RepID=A0A8D7FTK2_MUSAM|nr:unnamed protein product [Musa acuminata subsp. malaccensis]